MTTNQAKKRRSSPLLYPAALLSLASLAWTTWSLVDLLGTGWIGVTVAAGADIIWGSVIVAEARGLRLANKPWVVPTFGWITLLIVAGFLAMHGVQKDSIAMALAGPFLPFGAKAVWVLALADMRDPGQVAAMVRTVAERGGRLDYVVSNAAINPFMSWDETTVEDFNNLFETNVRGTWVVCTEGAKQMIREGHGGAICCVSSISAHVGAPGQTAYCGTNQTTIKNAQQQSASFNTAGDSGQFTPGTSADSKAARAGANYVFWDVLP